MAWEVKTLNQISENLDSKRVPITKKNRTHGSIPYYGASGIVDYVEEYIFDEELLLISEDGANLLARTYPIAFSISGKTWVNNHAHVLRFKDKISQRFVELYLNSIKFDDFVSGMAQPKLNQKMLNKIPIPFPPISEQKRIVAILDEAFKSIAKAKENAEKNLKNENEIFEGYLQSVFGNKGEGWEDKKLGEIANFEYGYTAKSKENGDFRYVRITDIDSEGSLTNTKKVYLTSSIEAMNFIVQNNDLLMARTGATFAKVLLYEDLEPSIFASYLIRIKFKDKIEHKFYWYFSKSRFYWDQANKLVSGSAQPHFNGNALGKMIFSYPKSLYEQELMVKEFDKLSQKTKKLEAIYTQKLADLEELKKSILAKAFNGELTEVSA